MKGHTAIPFAREAADLVRQGRDAAEAAGGADFWLRVAHFEDRYRSVDSLLGPAPAGNVLELSSGFSFRGLDAALKYGVHYIDTDLPGIIAVKKALLDSLAAGRVPVGQLETLALNALDEGQFAETVLRFPPGELTVVNEGLLMYLGEAEKKKLCGIIRAALLERGGSWITADVYLKMQGAREKLKVSVTEETKKFFERHRIEENKFDSFEVARAFFAEAGFAVEAEAQPARSPSAAMKRFLETLPPERLARLRGSGRIQATWRLRPVK